MSVASNLQSSITSLQNSINFLNCAIAPLRQVTHDVDRFKTVLRTKAVFDVIPESTVQKRTKAVSEFVEPRPTPQTNGAAGKKAGTRQITAWSNHQGAESLWLSRRHCPSQYSAR
ncbi:hypothetical protein KL906_001229 [Ogataea polymorpha]|nr:hypothetical protein KL908_003991 [Ogataea polymorpha]KAG7910849.1 hypothetical protein KL906_001229 [Ogataea polymorpha]